jgi:hypothetical protein
MTVGGVLGEAWSLYTRFFARWTVFGVMAITTLLSAIGATILSALLGFLPAFLERWLGGTIAGAVVAPFTAIAVMLMYFQLATTSVAEAPAQ